MIMSLYQDDEDLVIWVGDRPVTLVIGLTTLVIMIEKDKGKPNEWRTVLCAVAPKYSGTVRLIAALAATGWNMDKEAAHEDKAVAMAKFGYRAILWERRSSDWQADLETARRRAAELNEESNLIYSLFDKLYNGRTGYESMSS